MPARRASSDSSCSATLDCPIHRSTGGCPPGIHPGWTIPDGRRPVCLPWPPPSPTSTTRSVSGCHLRTSSGALLALGPGRSRRPVDLAATVAFALGGVLLIWSAYIHFHLWGDQDGYRSIPTIGPLFLLQSIAGLVIGIGVVAVRRLWAAVIGIGFALSTIAGFLLSVGVGLFGFKDSWLAPFAKESFTIEILAAAVFIAAATLCLVGSVPHARAGTTPAGTAT